MNNYTTPEERKLISQQLKGRILNVIPSASYQMDRFLLLVDLAFSDNTETAAIECGSQPKLILNKRFVEQYCTRDEHLFMLVMHELYHLTLGHTRLFPRLTRAHNIVFDAVINAMLCHQFPQAIYVEFFQKINPATKFPGRILRPPKGWPEIMHFPPAIKGKERKVMEILYGKSSQAITYTETMDLLMDDLGGKDLSNGTLLGDHSEQEENGLGDTKAVKDELVTGILKETIADWPMQSNPGKGKGEGIDMFSWMLPIPRSPRNEFVSALSSLFRKAKVLPASPNTPYAWKVESTWQSSRSVSMDSRDRTAEGRRILYGQDPIFYATEIPNLRFRWRPRESVHLYVDVSGSMSHELAWLFGILLPLLRRGECRLFAFSKVVDEVKRKSGTFEKIKNTYGTDINCVIQHLVSIPARQCPGKALILTDGYTGRPSPENAEALKHSKVELFIGLVGVAFANHLKPYARQIVQLPSIK